MAFNFNQGKTITKPKEKGFFGKTADFFVGAGKGALQTATGLSSLGERALRLPTQIAKGELRDTEGIGKGGLKSLFSKETSAQQLQSVVEEKRDIEKGSLFKPTTPAQKAGKFVEQVAEFAIPATKVAKATKGLSFIKRLATRATTSGAVATAQEGKVGRGTGIAVGIELLLPGASRALRPVQGIVSRLFKGLGASLSGVPASALEAIVKNPTTSREISEQIVKEGQEAILTNNANTILKGVAQIRQNARAKFGAGLEKLKEIDIKPKTIKDNIVKKLEENGIKVTKEGLDLSNSEILDSRIVERAIGLINKINEIKVFDGKRIRALMDKLESSKFKSSFDPDRQAFNNLMNDLGKGLRTAINESTDKLKGINKEFSQSMDLAESVQKIFGKVKFKNTSELNAIAKKLESLFSQKGLDPKTVETFLIKIGVNPADFRASEAVRTVATKTTGVNTKGLSFAEIIQQITSSVVTPNTVKNISIATGLGQKFLTTLIANTSPTARGAIIESLIGEEELDK